MILFYSFPYLYIAILQYNFDPSKSIFEKPLYSNSKRYLFLPTGFSLSFGGTLGCAPPAAFSRAGAGYSLIVLARLRPSGLAVLRATRFYPSQGFQYFYAHSTHRIFGSIVSDANTLLSSIV
jgi:hypothetical protein